MQLQKNSLLSKRKYTKKDAQNCTPNASLCPLPSKHFEIDKVYLNANVCSHTFQYLNLLKRVFSSS